MIIMIDYCCVQVAADVGEGVTLRCGVRAHPRPEFSWARADQATLSSRLGRIMAQVALYIRPVGNV